MHPKGGHRLGEGLRAPEPVPPRAAVQSGVGRGGSTSQAGPRAQDASCTLAAPTAPGTRGCHRLAQATAGQHTTPGELVPTQVSCWGAAGRQGQGVYVCSEGEICWQGDPGMWPTLNGHGGGSGRVAKWASAEGQGRPSYLGGAPRGHRRCGHRSPCSRRTCGGGWGRGQPGAV